MSLRGALILSLGVSACASSLTDLSHVVDNSLVDVFPPEGRRWTYEAENEVIIAIDRLATAREQLAAAEKKLDEAEDKEGGKGDAKVEDANRDWLKSMSDVAEAEVGRAEKAVTCAQANLELTKARTAVRFDLPVEEHFVEPFESQYNDCASNLEERRLEVEKLTTKSIEAKDNWRKIRVEYVRRSGDYDHGLWID